MIKQLLFLSSAMTLGLAAQAQTLPTPVAKIDFEGITSAEDLGAEQVGAGLFLQSEDKNFGTYYQNNPEGVKASHQNYLIIPSQAFINAKAKSAEQLTVAFWMNAYVANEKQGVDAEGHYYSTAISAYSSQNSYKTFSWPMFSARTRRTLQINCAGWSDFVNEENVNGNNVESNEWTWTKQMESGEVDEEGNPIMVNTAFDENWHFVTLTFNGINAKYYVDGEIMNEWNATNNNYSFPSVMEALDQIYLGDCGPFWSDKDGAYAYDDVAIYASELSKDDIDLLINIKRDQLTEEDKLIILRSQLETAITDLSDYCSTIGDTYPTLSNNVLDWLMEEYGDVDKFQTEEEINAAMAVIQAKQDEVSAITKAYGEALETVAFNADFLAKTNYAGAAAYDEAIKAATEAISDPTSSDVFTPALATLETAKVKYLFTQEGDVKDITRAISVPWFTAEQYEPAGKNEEDKYIFPEGAASHLSTKGWTMSFSESLRGATDCTLYFTNDVEQRPTANLFHSSTAIGTLDIQQTISGLQPGYYSVSADMSSTSDATDNHVYATAGNVTKVSAVFSQPGGGWTPWETLTTDKVRVGEDGTLTIGAASTTDGTQYKGWFCVTNFRLSYYGTEYDMSQDVTAKAEEVASAIDQLILSGDKAAAVAKRDAIINGELDDYDKVSQLTVLIAEINEIYAKEMAFTAAADMKNLADRATDDNAKSVYNTAASEIEKALNADDASIDIFDSLKSLAAAYTSFAEVAANAGAWEAQSVPTELASMLANLDGATVQSLSDNTDKLIAMMKSTITELGGSLESPKEITGIISSASFNGNSSEGWNISIDEGAWAISQGEIEFYNNNGFHLSQVLTAMPKGTYRLTASGFYRDGNDYAAIVANQWTKLSEESDSTVYDTRANVALTISAAGVTRESKLVSIASDSVVVNTDEDDVYTDYYGTTLHVIGDFTTLDANAEPVVNYPYWMSNAYHCITNLGLYAGNVIEIVVEEDNTDITIGAKKVDHIEGDWTIVDNFRLFYLGTDIPDAIDNVNDRVGSFAEASDIRTINGLRVSAPVRGINIVRKGNSYVKVIKMKD